MIRQRYLKVRLEEYIRISILTWKTKNLFLRVTKIVLFGGYPKSIKEGVLGFSKILQILLIVFNYSGFLRWLSSWFGRFFVIPVLFFFIAGISQPCVSKLSSNIAVG